MMNFLSNMNLIPKNFIVSNIVDTLKNDPENGMEKVFEMADNYITDPEIVSLIEQIKDAYYTRPSMRLYTKNLIYNTHKACLTHFLQNVVVKGLWEGFSKREQVSKKYNLHIPHALSIHIGSKKQGLSLTEIDNYIGQAREMGIHLLILTGEDVGGYGALEKLYEKYSDVQFMILTPGASLTPKRCQSFVKAGNVLPLIVMKQSEAVDVDHLKSSGLLFGMISKINGKNYQQLMSDATILSCIRKGARFHGYVTSESDIIDSKEMLKIKHGVDYIRQMRPYATLHLETKKPFNGESSTGGIMIEEIVGSQKHRLILPEITLENSKGKHLIQILKSI